MYSHQICKEQGCNSFVYARGKCHFHYKLERSKKSSKKQKKVDLFKPQIPLNELECLSLSDLKKISDYEARNYLLRRSTKNNRGQIKCFIDGKFYNKNKIEVAHLFPRSRMCLRYDLRNIHLCSKKSNTFDNMVYDSQLYGKGISKHEHDYTKKFIEVYGKEEYDKLKKDSEKICRYGKDDYICVIKKFRQ